MPGQYWEVVGGADKGGIIVRAGVDLKSKELPGRLATGAILEEVQLQGERLRYRRLTGTGPEEGWVSLKFKGISLVMRSEKCPSRSDDLAKPKFDPYGLLSIDHDATDTAIKSAFRKASVKVHPDRCPDDPEAATKFQELSHAKEFLRNPLKRRFYNLQHKLLKPVVNVEWWSDWDEVFDELDDDTCIDDDTSSGALSPALSSIASRTDIVLVGATGLAGAIACKIMDSLRSGRTWAVAGRDGRKLERLRQKFCGRPGFCGVSRVETQADLEALAKTARAVCDFTGPKAQIGTGMAEACVAAGTHYVEVTSEVIASRSLRDNVHSLAQEAGVCIVAAAGLNCSVQDLGTWYIVKYLREKYSVPTRRVDVYIHAQSMTVSGSLIATGLAVDVKQVETEIKEGGGSFFLGGMRPGGVREEDADQDEASLDAYTGMLATCGGRDPNQFHVRCSCGLFDASQPYGDRFLFKAWALYPDKQAADHAKFGTEYMKRFYKQSVAQKKIPPLGAGPSERLRQEAFCTRIFVAEADEAAESPRKAYLVVNAGPGGAGDTYEGTATTVIEAALTILDAADGGLEGALRPGYGTPAFHLAHLGFMQRLQARGFRAKVVEGAPSREFFRNVFSSAMPIGDAPEGPF